MKYSGFTLLILNQFFVLSTYVFEDNNSYWGFSYLDYCSIELSTKKLVKITIVLYLNYYMKISIHIQIFNIEETIEFLLFFNNEVSM